ncbi:MAG: nuclear transport factor 2 family protein [Bacteroidota bacterium]
MKSNIYNNISTFCFRASIFVILIVLITSCNSKNQPQDVSAVKAKIIQTEKDFETAVKENGIQQAFYDFADSNAVIKREDDRLIKGKEQIKTYYQNPSYKQDSVTWKPDFVEISNDGSLAYTYGKYVWKVKDSTGKVVEFNGVFHTVWKIQADGSWKYVWD